MESRVLAVHADLVRAGLLALAALDGYEARRWLDCDLASLAEGHLGERVDPRLLDDAQRAELEARAWEPEESGEEREPESSLRDRSEYELCYWLLREGKRVGTMALGVRTTGGSAVRLSSFYVIPEYRGRGVGRRAMESLMEVLGRHDLGLRLDTYWCWQRTVHFYVKLGLWVCMWKHDLCLCWYDSLPPPRILVGEQTASLSVPLDDGEVTLARAHRRGDVLELEDLPEPSPKALRGAYFYADGTLSLSLALHGWPLVRSTEEWERSNGADAGPPEALARKITLWEAWSKKHGWDVSTPRIPGLEYPTWDELEARWEARAAQRAAKEAAEPVPVEGPAHEEEARSSTAALVQNAARILHSARIDDDVVVTTTATGVRVWRKQDAEPCPETRRPQ